MITEQLVRNHLAFFKKQGSKCFKNQLFEKGIKYFEIYSRLAYHYNLFYCDDEVEAIIEKASEELLKKTVLINKKGRIVFYDSFSMDNRGLTQQYLRAIFSWNCEVLYITNANELGHDIGRELTTYAKAQVVRFDRKNINDYKRVTAIIAGFCPEKVFLHMTPWDIPGFLIINSLNNIERYMINLTDHAFWLGKNCADYIIEFRRNGVNLSALERQIAIHKLLLVPYYPIINQVDFQGFPFKSDKLIAFAGSNLYKISGRDNTFLKLIKEVLHQNQELIFVLAGPGKQDNIKKFISLNGIEDRFYLIGERLDISSVINKIDIFVNTYPMIGGLMTQYAAKCHKPIIGFTTPDLLAINDAEDLLQIEQNRTIVKTDISNFLHYFHQLINSNDQRLNNIELTKNSIPTPEEFNSRLYNIIYRPNKMTGVNLEGAFRSDKNAITNLHLEMENKYHHLHYQIIYDNIKFKILIHFPIHGSIFVFKKLKSVVTRRLNNKL